MLGVQVVVTEKADELLSKLPEEYVEEDYRIKLRKLGGMEVVQTWTRDTDTLY